MNTKNPSGQDVRTEQEELVSVFIPSEGTGAFLEGALNGVNFRIPTDTPVTVPKRIARVIAESRRTLLESSRAAQSYEQAGGRKLG